MNNTLRLNRLLARANSPRYSLPLRAQFLAEVRDRAATDQRIKEYLEQSISRYSLETWNNRSKL